MQDVAFAHHDMHDQVFIADLSKAMGYEVTSPWAHTDTNAAGSGDGVDGSAAAPASALPDTVEQMKSKMYQAKKLGFDVDAYVAPKGQTDLQTWHITDVDEEGITIVHMVSGKVEGDSKRVAWQQVFSDWRLHKGKVTTKLAGWSMEHKCSPLQSQMWQLEVAKGAIGMALMCEYAAKEDGIIDGLEVLQHPLSVRTNRGFKAGELQLIPATQRVERKPGEKGLVVGKFDLGGEEQTKLYIQPQFVTPMNSQGEKNKAPWVVPFWIVTSAEEKDANMTFTHIKKEVEGYTIYVPMLKNLKPLTSGTELKWNRKSAAIEPWKSRVAPSKAAQPKKKAAAKAAA